jgi:predicted DNA-binding transcriptional regulator YafY
LKNTHENPIYSKIEIEDISDKTELIKQLQESIISFKQIKFQFKNKYRSLEPYKITTFDGYWYLFGKDLNDNKLKTFYIKDINNLIVEDIFFEKNLQALKKLDSAINIWFEPNNDIFEARLLVKEDIAKYFKRRPLSKSQVILKENKDKSIEILLTATSKKELIYEVKKWQPNLLVIEPTNLVKEMLEISKNYYKEQLVFID